MTTTLAYLSDKAVKGLDRTEEDRTIDLDETCLLREDEMR
jgi:hypothetical protein